jgi:Short C-terminal domain
LTRRPRRQRPGHDPDHRHARRDRHRGATPHRHPRVPDATERDLGSRLAAAKKHAHAGIWHPSAPEPATQTAAGRYAALDQLAALHERGTISDQEFATEKTVLLARR